MTCNALTVTRRRAGGRFVDRWETVRAASFTLARRGCCREASVLFDKAFDANDVRWLGDELLIDVQGAQVYGGVVEDIFTSEGRLGVRAIGWFKALHGVYPTGFALGTQTANPSVNRPDSVVQYLLDNTALQVSQLGALDADQAPDPAIQNLVFGGERHAWDIFTDMATQAGGWAVGVAADKAVYFKKPASLPEIDARVCREADDTSTYQVRTLELASSLAYTEHTTEVEVRGFGGYRELFTAPEFGGSISSIAGLRFTNRRTLVRPDVHATPDSTEYKGRTVRSVDGAAVAEALLDEEYTKRLRFRLTLERMPAALLPWTHQLRVYDAEHRAHTRFRIETAAHTVDGEFLRADVEAVAI